VFGFVGSMIKINIRYVDLAGANYKRRYWKQNGLRQLKDTDERVNTS
jgi:hypothetical protein